MHRVWRTHRTKRMLTDLKNEICRDAIVYGKVDPLKRELLLKYNHNVKINDSKSNK